MTNIQYSLPNWVLIESLFSSITFYLNQGVIAEFDFAPGTGATETREYGAKGTIV